jgi:hypothetical protein
MSTEVRNIIVALKAQMSGAFSRTMAAGGSAISSIASKAGLAAKWIGGAGVAAAAGLSAMTVKIAGGMDKTGKLADRLGMTTESLVGLRHAAALADVSDLGGALSGWNKRLGEAVAGSGTAKDALTALGLSAKDLAALPMDQQILRLSDALAAVQNPAQRAALSAALFGRSAGAEMSTMLGEGSAAIRASMAEAEALGLTYNRSTASVAEAFNDNLTRIKAAVTGAATQAAAVMLPWFSQLSEGAIGWAKGVMPLVEGAMVKTFNVLRGVAVAFGGVWSAVWDAAGSILGTFGVTFSGTGDAIGKVCDWVVDGITWLASGVIKAITFIESVFVNWRDALEIVWKGALLGGVVFYETLKHWFTVALPAYLDWFGRNWQALFVDIWNATKTIVFNIGTNLWNFFESVWRWLKGEGWDFTWTGLLDGFKRTTEQLPKIAARTRTALEQSLSSDIAAATDRIGSYYQTKVTERLDKLQAGRRAADKAAAAAAAAADKATSSAAKAAYAVAAPVDLATSAGSKEFGVLGAAMSLHGLIANAAAPATDDAGRKTAANTSKIAATLDRMDKRAEDSSDDDRVSFTGGQE